MSRLAVRDLGTALSFDGVNDKVSNSNVPTGWDTASAAVVWYKVPKAIGALSRLKLLNVGGGGTNRIGMVVNIPSGRVDVGYFDGSTYTAKSGTPSNKPTGEWHSAIYSWDGATMDLYLDGVAQSGSNSPVSGVQTGVVFGEQGSANFGGLADEIALWTRPLNAEEAAAIARAGPYPTNSMWLYWKFDERSGTTAIDSSGNGNDGTIAGAAYTTDVPMKARTAVPESGDPRLMRKVVGGNLVLNGDFEYAPPFTAAQTFSLAWIDGTQTGSSSNGLFGWWFTNTGAGQSAQFDSAIKYNGAYSLKISAPVAGGGVSGQVVTLTSAVNPTAAQQKQYMVPVSPSTSYTMTARIKTDSVSNLASGGARIRALEYNGNSTSSISITSSSFITGTADWQLVTMTFTTSSTTAFIAPWLNLFGETGTVWFDDVVLKPTLSTGRAIVASRSLA